MASPKRSRKDVLSLLAEYRREKQLSPLREAQKSLAKTLDDLNAWGALDELRARRFSPHLCHGPAARDGLTPDVWVGVMIWHRPAGYLGYKTLTVIGMWAIAAPYAQAAEYAAPPQIVIGVKRLAFAAPFYDAGAYFVLIRRAFDLYYNDNGFPPTGAGRIAQFNYDPARRLELREEVARALLTCSGD